MIGHSLRSERSPCRLPASCLSIRHYRARVGSLSVDHGSRVRAAAVSARQGFVREHDATGKEPWRARFQACRCFPTRPLISNIVTSRLPITARSLSSQMMLRLLAGF